jgi:phosphatidate phosphatase APP1
MVIISDIDDTVMVTGVAHELVMLWRLFARPAASRVPFPGVAAFYRALHAGGTGQEQNPMLYVSRGPWTNSMSSIRCSCCTRISIPDDR